ncbi:MAG: RloB domain-containing protein [Gemmatimonadales bacterium]|jgi:hypothetical protein|nr:RloB domain-containing protein [Gemmatimonadales bacterium]
MASRKRRRSRRPARRRAIKEPKRRLLVVCEGERTEPEYLRGFQRHVRNATVEIEIPNERGDPKKLVEIAKERGDQARHDAARQRDDFLAFDEVWCVFDRDEHTRFDDAVSMARDNGIELAVSNPCVELWLLLHFRDSPGARHRHDIQRLMRNHLPGYDKGIEFDAVAFGIKEASTRARRLDDDAQSMGEAGRNPTTGFYRLTDSIARRQGG